MESAKENKQKTKQNKRFSLKDSDGDRTGSKSEQKLKRTPRAKGWIQSGPFGLCTIETMYLKKTRCMKPRLHQRSKSKRVSCDASCDAELELELELDESLSMLDTVWSESLWCSTSLTNSTI